MQLKKNKDKIGVEEKKTNNYELGSYSVHFPMQSN